MRLGKRLQLTILSVSLVVFVLSIFIYFKVEDATFVSESASPTGATSLKIDSERIQLYLDENNNQQKDTDEQPCSQCVAKQIIAKIETVLGEELVVKEVSDTSELDFANTEAVGVWGYLPGEKLLLPYYSFTEDMAGGEILIPVEKVNFELAGENANIKNISVKKLPEDYYEIQFTFSTLVPALEALVRTEKNLWLIYYPGEKSESNYHISAGKIVSGPAGVFTMKTLWLLPEENKNLTEPINYKLLIPSGN